jgi:large subunit ribosomal protein L25
MVDVSTLTGIGDTITVADLILPKGVTVLSDSTEMLAVVTMPAQAPAEEEEELEEELDLDVEPEVIGREDEEEEE